MMFKKSERDDAYDQFRRIHAVKLREKLDCSTDDESFKIWIFDLLREVYSIGWIDSIEFEREKVLN